VLFPGGIIDQNTFGIRQKDLKSISPGGSNFQDELGGMLAVEFIVQTGFW
jgi:hypothetical protein